MNDLFLEFSSLFHLSSDGQLTFVGTLPHPIKSLFRLNIQAHDRAHVSSSSSRHTAAVSNDDDVLRLSSETIVFTVIPLIGESDSMIKFTQSEYRFEVGEDAKVGSILGSVHIESNENAGNYRIRFYFKMYTVIYI